LWESAEVLKVPSSALFRSGERWAVFVVDQGRARLRVVEMGHRNPSEAEITAGLAAGEVVVRHPSDRVADGVRVR
jgi:HlyD family secretion protein